MNARYAPSRGAFFNPRPLFLDPALDPRLIPLDGSALWFLGTPTECAKQPTDMINVKPAEVRAFLYGQLTPERDKEIKDKLLIDGVPL